MIKNVQIGFVEVGGQVAFEVGGQVAFGNGETDRVGNALAQRSRADLDACEENRQKSE